MPEGMQRPGVGSRPEDPTHSFCHQPPLLILQTYPKPGLSSVQDAHPSYVGNTALSLVPRPPRGPRMTPGSKSRCHLPTKVLWLKAPSADSLMRLSKNLLRESSQQFCLGPHPCCCTHASPRHYLNNRGPQLDAHSAAAGSQERNGWASTHLVAPPAEMGYFTVPTSRGR